MSKTETRTNTQDPSYATWLSHSESVWWKRLLDVQRPYRWNLQRLGLGHTLDIGCGVGRNLGHLRGKGVGIDHNATSVAMARSRGLEAFTPDELEGSKFGGAGRFDSILVSHVLEHMTEEQAVGLLREHLHRLKKGGRVVVITPQERGYASDPTHVTFMDFVAIRRVFAQAGLTFDREFSFPFARPAGRVFRYNEFVALATTPN